MKTPTVELKEPTNKLIEIGPLVDDRVFCLDNAFSLSCRLSIEQPLHIAKLAGQRSKLELTKQRISELAVWLAVCQLIEIELDRYGCVNSRQLERLANEVLVILQAFAIGFVRDLVGVLHRGLGRAEFQDELESSLGPDARRTGNVVDRVTHQPQKIYDLRWRHAKFVENPGFVTPFDGRHRHLALCIHRIIAHRDN